MNENDFLDVEQSFSDDNVVSESDSNNIPSVLMIDDTYTGTISDTYLDYFEGIVEKLPYNEHYLIWRAGQYEYCIAYGEDLYCDGYMYTGSNLWITTIWRNSDNYNSVWYISHDIDDISVDTYSIFAYSDIGNVLPTVERGGSSYEILALCFSLCTLLLYCVIRDIFKYIKR